MSSAAPSSLQALVERHPPSGRCRRGTTRSPNAIVSGTTVMRARRAICGGMSQVLSVTTWTAHAIRRRSGTHSAAGRPRRPRRRRRRRGAAPRRAPPLGLDRLSVAVVQRHDRAHRARRSSLDARTRTASAIVVRRAIASSPSTSADRLALARSSMPSMRVVRAARVTSPLRTPAIACLHRRDVVVERRLRFIATSAATPCGMLVVRAGRARRPRSPSAACSRREHDVLVVRAARSRRVAPVASIAARMSPALGFIVWPPRTTAAAPIERSSSSIPVARRHGDDREPCCRGASVAALSAAPARANCASMSSAFSCETSPSVRAYANTSLRRRACGCARAPARRRRRRAGCRPSRLRRAGSRRRRAPSPATTNSVQ